jgi:hypothetical protein
MDQNDALYCNLEKESLKKHRQTQTTQEKALIQNRKKVEKKEKHKI